MKVTLGIGMPKPLFDTFLVHQDECKREALALSQALLERAGGNKEKAAVIAALTFSALMSEIGPLPGLAPEDLVRPKPLNERDAAIDAAIPHDGFEVGDLHFCPDGRHVDGGGDFAIYRTREGSRKLVGGLCFTTDKEDRWRARCGEQVKFTESWDEAVAFTAEVYADAR